MLNLPRYSCRLRERERIMKTRAEALQLAKQQTATVLLHFQISTSLHGYPVRSATTFHDPLRVARRSMVKRYIKLQSARAVDPQRTTRHSKRRSFISYARIRELPSIGETKRRQLNLHFHLQDR